MNVRIKELKDAPLDWAVAAMLYPESEFGVCVDEIMVGLQPFSPSTDWSQGGPLLDEYKPTVMEDGEGGFMAGFDAQAGDGAGIYMEHSQGGRTYLEAAMRSIVAAIAKSDVIDVPDDLLAAIRDRSFYFR